MKNEHSILALCEILDVSTSGYYDWLKRLACPGARAVENLALSQDIDLIHAQSRRTYGSPRVMQELRKKGRRHGRRRIARLMQQKGLCGRQKGRHRVQTTDSQHGPAYRAPSPGGDGPGHRAQPTLGGRHYLYSNPGRLALSGRHAGPLQP
jgi:transposase InsO family protein